MYIINSIAAGVSTGSFFMELYTKHSPVWLAIYAGLVVVNVCMALAPK